MGSSFPHPQSPCSSPDYYEAHLKPLSHGVFICTDAQATTRVSSLKFGVFMFIYIGDRGMYSLDVVSSNEKCQHNTFNTGIVVDLILASGYKIEAARLDSSRDTKLGRNLQGTNDTESHCGSYLHALQVATIT